MNECLYLKCISFRTFIFICLLIRFEFLQRLVIWHIHELVYLFSTNSNPSVLPLLPIHLLFFPFFYFIKMMLFSLPLTSIRSKALSNFFSIFVVILNCLPIRTCFILIGFSTVNNCWYNFVIRWKYSRFLALQATILFDFIHFSRAGKLAINNTV